MISFAVFSNIMNVASTVASVITLGAAANNSIETKRTMQRQTIDSFAQQMRSARSALSDAAYEFEEIISMIEFIAEKSKNNFLVDAFIIQSHLAMTNDEAVRYLKLKQSFDAHLCKAKTLLNGNAQLCTNSAHPRAAEMSNLIDEFERRVDKLINPGRSGREVLDDTLALLQDCSGAIGRLANR